VEDEAVDHKEPVGTHHRARPAHGR
jgi:hypothetical protein